MHRPELKLNRYGFYIICPLELDQDFTSQALIFLLICYQICKLYPCALWMSHRGIPGKVDQSHTGLTAARSDCNR